MGWGRSTGRRPARWLLALVTVLLVGLPAVPAQAVEVTASAPRRVLGDLTEQAFTVRLATGQIARGRLLRFPERHPTLDLRPWLAGGVAAGLQSHTAMARQQLRRGAAAGVNGGNWLNRPTGVPNGLYIASGQLVAGQSDSIGGTLSMTRGALGIHADGRLVMERVDVSLTLHRPDGQRIAIDEINRRPRVDPDEVHPHPADGEVIVYNDLFGAQVEVPAGSVVVTADELDLGSSGQAAAPVRARRSHTAATTVTVADGQTVVVAHGTHAGRLDSLEPGTALVVETSIDPLHGDPADWQDLAWALPAGPLLLRDGDPTNAAERAEEAFSHVNERHPRTAVATTTGGDALLVVVDGRQPGWSVGVTLHELTQVLLAFGARDALNLDGGGSTTMTVGAAVRNRPSERGRAIANSLFVYAPLPPGARDISAHACPPGAVPPSGFDDVAGTIHATAIECLAWWDVTAGVTEDRYGPERAITRAQMASYLERWIDQAAAHGDGTPLPDARTSPFRDVDIGATHGRAIARLAAAGIVRGGAGGHGRDVYVPGAAVTRAQMATFVAAAYAYVTGDQLPAVRDTFVDDTGSVHEAAIDRLAAAGITGGTIGLVYAPAAPVSRGAMASFVMRSGDLLVAQAVTTPPG